MLSIIVYGMTLVMTLIVLFHASAYRNFKSYYTEHVLKHLRGELPHLVPTTALSS